MGIGLESTLISTRGQRILPTLENEVLRMQQNPDDVGVYNRSVDPEGDLPANPGSLCHQQDTGEIWRKATGTGNTGWVRISGSDSSLQIFRGKTVNLLVPGDYELMTVDQDFVIVGVTGVNIDVTGSPTNNATGSMGWVAPDYQEIMSDISVISFASGIVGFYTQNYPQGNAPLNSPILYIPAGSTIFMKVQTPESTSTTATIRVDLYGYYLNGTNAENGSVPASGNLQLLETQVASNDSTIDFVNGIIGYDQYKLVFTDVELDTITQNLQVQYSTDGGGTWENTSYANINAYASGTGTGAFGGATTSNSLLFNVENTQPLLKASGEAVFTNLGNGALYSNVNSIGNCVNGGELIQERCNGYWGDVSIVNGLRLSSSSGNILTGTFKLYGVIN